MDATKFLEDALKQKEQALIQYVRYMREAQDSQKTEMAALFCRPSQSRRKAYYCDTGSSSQIL